MNCLVHVLVNDKDMQTSDSISGEYIKTIDALHMIACLQILILAFSALELYLGSGWGTVVSCSDNMIHAIFS